MELIKIKPSNKLEVRYVNDEIGFGVFALKNIKKNTLIEMCYCLVMDFAIITHPSYDYVFTDIKNNKHYLPFGFGSIYNHSYTPNIVWNIVDYKKKIINFYSLIDIKIGEELCHNYGEYYWKTREKKLL